MKKKVVVTSVVVAICLIFATGVYAWWGDNGMGYRTGVNVETMRKFQKESLNLRDEIMIKQMELQNEYSKSVPDTNRIASLKKEIIDLQVKIQAVADKYGYGGNMGGMMMNRRMMQQGMMMGSGMGMGMGMGMCGGW